MVAGVWAGSLMPGRAVPTFAVGDKILHAAAYFLLMAWFSGLFQRERQLTVAAVLLAMGFALDGMQGALSTRSFDLMDVVANAGGILLGLILARLWLEGWCRKIERYFLA